VLAGQAKQVAVDEEEEEVATRARLLPDVEMGVSWNFEA